MCTAPGPHRTPSRFPSVTRRVSHQSTGGHAGYGTRMLGRAREPDHHLPRRHRMAGPPIREPRGGAPEEGPSAFSAPAWQTLQSAAIRARGCPACGEADNRARAGQALAGALADRPSLASTDLCVTCACRCPAHDEASQVPRFCRPLRASSPEVWSPGGGPNGSPRLVLLRA